MTVLDYCKEIMGEIQHRLIHRCGVSSMSKYEEIKDNPAFLNNTIMIRLIFENLNVSVTYFCRMTSQWDLERLYIDVLEHVVKNMKKVLPEAKGSYDEIKKFLKTLNDMELVQMQKESREARDEKLLDCVLKELGERQKKKND